jgi:hypothetical protein
MLQVLHRFKSLKEARVFIASLITISPDGVEKGIGD